MLKQLRKLPIALAILSALALSPNLWSADIRDSASLFDADVVKRGNARLSELERETNVPVTIETINTLDGRDIATVLPEHAKKANAKGIYVLIAKAETKIRVEASKDYLSHFPSQPALTAIRTAFLDEFKKKDFTGGLKAGVKQIEATVRAAAANSGGKITITRPNAAPHREPAARPGPVAPAGPKAGFGLRNLVGIGLVVFAVLIGIRVLGALFRGGGSGYAGGPRPMGGPGYGPGGGPGYGPGYGGGGGGGGGFMSSLFGGIGGALAGNWLYDQFSGRNRHDYGGGTSNTGDTYGGEPHAGNEGGEQWGSQGAEGDWSGGDTGGGAGGDWGGGGDTGGGGDWGGGGGGDWGGGGGGDSGGGGGGGDW